MKSCFALIYALLVLAWSGHGICEPTKQPPDPSFVRDIWASQFDSLMIQGECTSNDAHELILSYRNASVFCLGAADSA